MPLDLLEEASITRFPSPQLPSHLTREEKIALIQEHFAAIMQTLGLDLSDPSLSQTPKRVAKMYVDEIFAGLDPKKFPAMTFIEDKFHEKESNIVLVKEISVNSFCEHHFVPITGTAKVAYLPNTKIVGLSKINRIVDYFSRRPQLQERLTAQIADSLSTVLETEDVAVSIAAHHFCVTMRGIHDSHSLTETHVLHGKFKTDPFLRQEFFGLIPTTN